MPTSSNVNTAAACESGQQQGGREGDGNQIAEEETTAGKHGSRWQSDSRGEDSSRQADMIHERVLIAAHSRGGDSSREAGKQMAIRQQ